VKSMAQEKKNILIVDDSPDNITILGEILSAEYAVTFASNGATALKMIDSDPPPDLVLLDIMMPQMDGLEVCRRIKSNPKTREIPVIFVTSMGEDIKEAEGFFVGGADYLTKPVSPVVVRARVRTHLSMSSLRNNLARQNEILRENMRLREDVERITRHDLKNPITAFVTIPASMSKDKNLNQNQREMLEMLNKAGLRSLEMVNRTLDLYKMEQGLYELNPGSVNVAEIIRNIVSEFAILVSEKRISVIVLSDGLPAKPALNFIVMGEEFLFYSMLSNLIKNALEASPHDREVKINLVSFPRATIEIWNQGEIPTEIRGRFTERYATFGKKAGTGLGAYSARMMAKTLGGELSFQTSSAKGTFLRVTLAGGSLSTTISETASVDFGTIKSRATVRILVVDDYAIMRKLITSSLRQSGFLNIVEAEDVKCARGFLEKEIPDLVLSDWDMPGGTGLDLLRMIRAAPDGKNIPFLLITGRVTQDAIKSAQDAGVTGILWKPFSHDILTNKVEGLLCLSDDPEK